ncbi:ABC-2 type transport system permease protein [Pelagirhabdus alkalitolerans]|uniref:ABC-2 type transport system permease protein n=1 Tax=Pelagirhabdus alkalitolerans TaxID=1612202 RepID=A0A1G6JP85_9BACI|nr:ABC transporter permease [Pelagirhabdus alkalitolerans]SDC20549.1 ABC-2 type transport system permease protein [Pelagirhabdus alkalitolerans]
MWNLFKKDFLTISRDRAEVMTLILMPFILIAILGMALGGLMTGEVNIEPIDVVIQDDHDTDTDLDTFESTLIAQQWPDQVIDQVMTEVDSISPVYILQNVLEDAEEQGWVNILETESIDDLESALMDEEIMSVIRIPDGFTQDALSALFLEEETTATLDVTVSDGDRIYSDVIEQIIATFVEQYNLEASIAQNTEEAVDSMDEQSIDLGSIQHLPNRTSVSAFQYYTVGMAAMFALYVASTIASLAFKEKTSQAFMRLMLTNQSPVSYLVSKLFSSFIVVMLQLSILFALSTVIFDTFTDTSIEFWLGILWISANFALVVGAMSSVLTALTLHFNNDSVSGVFAGGLVTLFAFIGGSLTPVDQISPLIYRLGNWTPNGAMMTAYLQWIQGVDLIEVLPMIYRVWVMSVVMIVVAVWIFPKRRLT